MKYADIDWTDDKTPRANQFGDIYFSVEDGLAESQHVFINQNFLPDRFRVLAQQEQPQHFVIAETGFGSGLNFIAAYLAWVEAGLLESVHRLTFISTEKFPLSPTDFARFSELWPEQQGIYQTLRNAYPSLLEDQQTLIITDKIKINLLIGDAAKAFTEVNIKVDAWFLDGFAPSKNPEMWSNELFSEVARLSHTHSTYATFTSARIVKDAISKVGFEVNKCRGFGRKRDMCFGTMQQKAQINEIEYAKEPGFKPWHVSPSVIPQKKTALVIGAGLAGAHTAFNLANRGWQVTVIESKACAADGASGNQQGVIYTKPSSHGSKEDRFYMQCFQYAIQHYASISEHLTIPEQDMLWQQDGLLQLAQSEKDEIRLSSAYQHLKHSDLVDWLTAEQASEMAGVNIKHPALWFKSSGWVQPRKTALKLLEHPAIRLVTHTQVKQLQQLDTHEWRARCVKQQHSEMQSLDFQASICILTNAWQAKAIDQATHLNLRPVRGQVSAIPSNTKMNQLKTAICSDAYVTPPLGGQLNFGATFYNDQTSVEITDEDHQSNLNKLARMSDDLNLSTMPLSELEGRAGVRCITHDRLPVVGPLNNHEYMVEYYQMLSRDKNWAFSPPSEPQFYSGLFCNLGFASKGLTTIPLCTEYLCNLIEGRLLNFDLSIRESVSSSRFTIKPLIKGKL